MTGEEPAWTVTAHARNAVLPIGSISKQQARTHRNRQYRITGLTKKCVETCATGNSEAGLLVVRTAPTYNSGYQLSEDSSAGLKPKPKHTNGSPFGAAHFLFIGATFLAGWSPHSHSQHTWGRPSGRLQICVIFFYFFLFSRDL